MRRNPLYLPGIAAFLLLLLAGCGAGGKKLNERITLWRGDKIPYGTWYFHEQLPQIFPEARVVNTRESPYNSSWFGKNYRDLQRQIEQNRKRSARIIIAPRFQPGKEEWLALQQFVWQGNSLFISSFNFAQELLDSLHLKVSEGLSFLHASDSLSVSVLRPRPLFEQVDSFSYPGKSFDGHFSRIDSEYVTMLGWDQEGKADYVRISYEGGGAIYLHLAPLAFSNFFLLHKNNKRYFDNALSHLPKGLKLIIWDDYFRSHAGGSGSGNQALSWIMNQRGLSAALWLLLALLALVLLFESKRRQRIVENIPPLRNSSLDFVNTIGRLYYQRHDNRNLAAKMAAHFLDEVRRRFNLPTSQLTEEFEHKLAFKTGYDPEELHQLIYQLKYLQELPQVSDDELLEFNQRLEKFYKQT